MEPETILKDVVVFFESLDPVKINIPRIRISLDLNDAASYDGNGLIELNPKHNTEGLRIEEMVAHEFFHHIQHELFWKLLAKPLGEEQKAAIYEFFEGASFLFAALYVNRESTSATAISSYMAKKEHMTKSGVGNEQALRAFEVSGSDPKKFARNVLDKNFIYSFLS